MTEIDNNKVNIEEFWFDLRSGQKHLTDFPDDVVNHATELSNLNRLELQAVFDRGVLHEKSSPRVGNQAPEFRLELLNRQGRRTGKFIRLSQNLEKPVALVFGNYT